MAQYAKILRADAGWIQERGTRAGSAATPPAVPDPQGQRSWPRGRRAAKLPDAPFQRKGARAGRTAGPDPPGPAELAPGGFYLGLLLIIFRFINAELCLSQPPRGHPPPNRGVPPRGGGLNNL